MERVWLWAMVGALVEWKKDEETREGGDGEINGEGLIVRRN